MSQNKLLEQTNAERLDIGAKDATIKPDTPLKTVGALDRAKNIAR
jgi:hypothetical protein